MGLILMLIVGILIAEGHTAKELPIGLILDEHAHEAEMAFNFATMVINNDPTFPRLSGRRMTLKVLSINRTDVSDNYKLGAAICSMANKGVSAIIGISHPVSYNTIQSYSHALQIPYILVSPSRSSSTDIYKYDISLSPPYSEVVIDLIDRLQWPKVYYIYDSDDGLWRLQKVYEYFQRRKYGHIIIDAYRIKSVENSYDQLRRLDNKEFEIKRIVLDLSSADSYRTILEQVVDMGMNRDNYHYILSGLGAVDLNTSNFYDMFLYGGVNITAFNVINTYGDMYKRWGRLAQKYSRQFKNIFPFTTNTALMIDAIMALYESIAPLYDQNGLRDEKTFRPNRGKLNLEVQCRAEVLKPSRFGHYVLNTLLQVKFQGLTGLIVFDPHGVRINYSLDVMNLGFQESFKKIKTWTPRTSKELPDYAIKINASSLYNRTQKIATVMEQPFTMIKKDRDGEPPHGGSQGYEGYCVDLIALVAKKVGFEYTLLPSNDYGKKLENGSWTGMIGELVRKEKDIAVASLTITEERERAVDFSKPFMSTGISIMIKKPDKQKPGVFSFMQPLDKTVWICIGIGFLAVSFVLFFVGRFSPYEWSGDGDKDEEVANTFTISNTMWFSLGALMQQGSDISPRSLSGRLIGSAWWFFTLIIISSYTANLAAFLTIEKMLTPIASADDLVKQTDIKYGTKSEGSSWKFFEESQVPVYSIMYKYMKDNKDTVLHAAVENGVEMVRNNKGKYAFLLESTMNNYYNQREPCDTIRVGDNLDNKGYGIATPVGYPHRDAINIAVLELREVGELHKLEQKWWYDKGECGNADGSKDASQSALTLSNVSGIFHILIGGLVLAMITSSLEYLVQRKLYANKAKKNAKKGPVLKQTAVTRRRRHVDRDNLDGAGPGVTSYSPERENGGCNMATGGAQLINFDSHPSDHTEI
ncbi:hypothetical protein SNE40_016574 [Patella caerulea]|uniref:Glutamate receptor n=1 Tax=Patella caerulea TaxID=87958 RepID=A0AAN8PDX1_PATCE